MRLWVMTGKLETIKTQCHKMFYVFFLNVDTGKLSANIFFCKLGRNLLNIGI